MTNLNNTALLNTYIQTKKLERDMREKRTELEKQILEAYGDNLSDDTTSKTFYDGNFRITIKRNIVYKLTEEGWDIVANLPEDKKPVKISLDESKAKKMECLKDYIQTHENKPSIDVVIG